MNEITRSHIQQLHSKIGGRSKIQANRTLETISAVYRYAQNLGIVEEGYNPTNRIKSFKETPRIRYLSEKEFMRLGAALEIAETDGIPWDLPPDTPVSKHTVKPGNQKTVFPKGATDTIRLLMFKSGQHVFPSEFSDAPRADLNKPWRAIRRHAGAEDLRLHDLRHSFASVGAGAGMGLPIVGALLGHKQAATTQRYAHLDTSPLRQASDEIGAKIANAMNRETA